MASAGDAGRYLLTRTKAESDRLELQHRAFQQNIGFLLHPAIPRHGSMRIADIGTGTGAWLRDLAKELPTTCRLDGFDISLDQVPGKDLFPSDINYYVQDLLKPFPTEFLGQYDVVHVRLLVMGLQGSEWEIAIKNLMTLLRPSGHLQWTDLDPHTGAVIPGTHGCNVDDADIFLKQIIKVSSRHGKSGKSVPELLSHFEKSGLIDCKEEIIKLEKPEFRNNINTTTVKVIEHILHAAKAADQESCTLTLDQITSQKEAAMKNLKETNSWITHDLHVVIGKRA
ncbi:hypothetical protein AJ79_05144 [Helicocarpus griseus UAMH5409]|uniref:Methyltransferase domain-containing protein n=1 Tax=Helicocarpus griseus UAMH5409 TaxID=1447875 RepID=A0A2B7XQG1_9EURO|nr:hypothetical protein AJ79_05144 [Helicocarpus griseus UAMH5409]